MGTQILQIHIIKTLTHLLGYIVCSYDQWNVFKNLSKSDLSTFFQPFFQLIWLKKICLTYVYIHLLNFLTCFQMLYKNVIWLKRCAKIITFECIISYHFPVYKTKFNSTNVKFLSKFQGKIAKLVQTFFGKILLFFPKIQLRILRLLS